MLQTIEYTIEINNYTQAQQILNNCNGLVFQNIGGNDILVDGYRLEQKQQLLIGGNLGEIINKTFNVQFDTTNNLDNEFVVIKKIYTN